MIRKKGGTGGSSKGVGGIGSSGYRSHPSTGPYSPAKILLRLVGLACLFAFGYVFVSASANQNKFRSHLQEEQGLDASGKSKIVQIVKKDPDCNSAARFVKCTAEQAKLQGQAFPAAKVRGCPPSDDMWLRLVHMIIPHAQVFVDIGSNKGYTAARFYSLWNPHLGLDAPLLYRHIKKTSQEPTLRECGACGDCREEGGSLFDLQARLCSDQAMYTSDGNKARSLMKAGKLICGKMNEDFAPIRVYSFDGNDVLVDGVKMAIQSMNQEGSSPKERSEYSKEFIPANPLSLISKSWSVELRAFTATCKPGETLTFIQNGELGHISDGSSTDANSKLNKVRSAGREVIVPCITVDQFLEKENLQHIDFLKIDTEGHDLSVLEGATKLLEEGRATVIVFEYNIFWPETRNGELSLKSIAGELGNKNYVCYLEGKNVLVRITECWDDALGERQWSNIWCFSASHPQGSALVSIFDSYSLAFVTL